MSSLVEAARQVLELNSRHDRYTVPSPKLYPHQWAWDSAFIAIGWSHFDAERGLRELEALFDGQWADGRVPHIVFHDREGSYFPNPSFWRTEWTSSISQPPAWALAIGRLFDAGADRQRLAALVEQTDRSHAWFLTARDPLGWNAVAVAHPWESGLDNGPTWDAALHRVDPASAPPFRRVDTTHVADASQRPTTDEYARYAALVAQIADADFGMGEFAVYDPLMTALLVAAERELDRVAQALGVETGAGDRAERVAKGLDSLWSEPHGRYLHVDASAAALPLDPPNVIGHYVPLLVEADAGRRESLQAGLAKDFATPYPFPSTAPSDPAFEPQRYWRGPTWVNINWLLAPHAGFDAIAPTMAMVREHGFREYYDARTGAGLGAEQFAWTAALVLDWIHRGLA